MTIGVVAGGLRGSGGAFQYTHTMLEALAELRPRLGHEVVLVHARGAELPASVRDWRAVEAPPSRSPRQRMLDRLRLALGRPQGAPPRDLDRVRRRPRLTRALREAGIELAVYTSPTPAAFEAGVPYVMPVHDLQHRLQPEFPEVSADGEWEAREYLYRHGIRKAVLVLADSEVGREDVVELYGVPEEQVAVLPFAPAVRPSEPPAPGERARVRAAYGLPDRYAFYPAQFWPHKNHVRIVEAVAALRADGLEAPVAFAGTATGELRRRTLTEVRERAAALGIADRVHVLGYVPDEDLAPLYAGAVALVMPTFFGPTNIPILEAWAVGCPVLTSDLRGVRDQAGDAAVLADPRSPEAIAEALARLWTDETLRRELAERGRARLAAYGYPQFRDRLGEIVARAVERVRQTRGVS